MIFKVNPKINGTHVHHKGRVYRKGVSYDSILEKLPAARLGRMLELKINGIPFFMEEED